MIAKQIGAAIREVGGSFVETVLLLGGAGLVSYGAWEAYPPAGPITAGALLIAGVILRARGQG